jgi:hypothetical protein
MNTRIYEVVESEDGHCHIYHKGKFAMGRGGQPLEFTGRGEAEQWIRRIMRLRKNLQARATRAAYAALGLHRVKGALGGIYYE